MKEHTIPSTTEWYSDIEVEDYYVDDNVGLQRTWNNEEDDCFWIDSGEREELGRLLLNDVDDVDVVEETPAQEIADDTPTKEIDVIGDTIVLDDFFGSEVEFITGSEVMIDDGSGGEVVLMGGETKNLYGVLDERFGEDRPVDELFDDDGHNENQSLPDNRDEYDWFDPDAENVTCLTDGDTYDVNKYIVEKERTCTLVEQIGHHYKHVQLHEKEVENLRELWDDSKGDDSDDDDDSSESTCVCGNSVCNYDITPAQQIADGGILEYGYPDVGEMEFGNNSEEDDRPIDELFPQVSLDTEVSVEGATEEQRQMYRDMGRLVEDNYETFVNKNISYGNSFLNTEVGLNEGGPFDNQFQSNANGLLVRMDDKMTRLENLLLTDSEDRVGEEAVETALDLSNYSLMLAYLVQERGEN